MKIKCSQRILHGMPLVDSRRPRAIGYNLEAELTGLAVRRHIKSANPFYGLLVVTGLLFAITAVCYGVMAFREAKQIAVVADGAVAVDNDHPLLRWMRRHGEVALLGELGFLAIFTFAAIGTDDYWQRRANQQRVN
jgi:hypothetical protein